MKQKLKRGIISISIIAKLFTSLAPDMQGMDYSPKAAKILKQEESTVDKIKRLHELRDQEK